MNLISIASSAAKDPNLSNLKKLGTELLNVKADPSGLLQFKGLLPDIQKTILSSTLESINGDISQKNWQKIEPFFRDDTISALFKQSPALLWRYFLKSSGELLELKGGLTAEDTKAFLKQIPPEEKKHHNALTINDLQIQNLEDFRGFEHIHTLVINDCYQLKSLDKIQNLFPNLTTLKISHCGIENLKGLEELKNLKNLELEQCSQLKDLSALKNKPLTKLSIISCTNVRSLDFMGTETIQSSLTELSLNKMALVTHLNRILLCKNLQKLDIRHTQIKNLAPLAAQGQFKNLVVQVTQAQADSFPMDPSGSSISFEVT
jgi:hypothetical protein